MFMSAVARELNGRVYPELAGARVMITGLTAKAGVDVARVFAEHKGRLVIQSPEASQEITELAGVLAQSAAAVKLFNDPFTSADDAVRFAQGPAQDYGGLDAVINLVEIDGSACVDPSFAGVEAMVSDKFLGATLMTRVAANRMRLTLSEGLILNVAICSGADDRARAFSDVARATLAALTRGEAAQWGEHGIRINAIAPRLPGAESDAEVKAPSGADIAALALYLASNKGRGLSGQLFDAEGVAARRC